MAKGAFLTLRSPRRPRRGRPYSTVVHALDRLSDQGKVIDRKHRRIQLKLPDGRPGLQLIGVDFTGQNLRGQNFRGAILERANFRGADLTGANFRGASLYRADFSEANLSDTNLRKATAHFANFQNSILVGTDAIGTGMMLADIRGAEVCGLPLEGPSDSLKPQLVENRALELIVPSFAGGTKRIQ